MPTKSKRNYTRRRRRRPYKRYKRPFSVSQNNNGIARRQIVRMTYIQQISLNPTLGVSATHVFSANGCYDPDITGVGTQPYGFDQWMPFYNHFVVLGSKCSVSFIPTGTGDNGAFIGSISLKSSTTSSPTELTRQLEYPQTVYRMCGNSRANNGITLSKNFSAKKFLGRASPLSDPALKGSVSANPTEGAYYHVTVTPNTATGDLSSVDCLVRINYIVALIEPSILPKS